jgi:hypothetical protein
MGPISEKIVENTWQEVAGFSPGRANKEIMMIRNRQPELLAFVMESAKEMGQEVRGFAIYMFLIVYRMFQGAHERIEKISSEEIMKCYEHNVGLMERLEGTHEKFLDRIASVQTSREPYVVKHLVNALMEEDTVALTGEQKGFLFLLLKTVIDALNQKSMHL